MAAAATGLRLGHELGLLHGHELGLLVLLHMSGLNLHLLFEPITGPCGLCCPHQLFTVMGTLPYKPTNYHCVPGMSAENIYGLGTQW
jgi:hypothetical protein